MAAEADNKYAEKWDIETAKKFFQDSLAKVKEDTEIKWIGSLAVKMNTYRELFDYLLKKFGEQDNDFHTIKKEIDSTLESRVVDKALEGKYNATFSIFHLKNNHNWKDKQEHDIDGNIGYQIIEPKKDED